MRPQPLHVLLQGRVVDHFLLELLDALGQRRILAQALHVVLQPCLVVLAQRMLRLGQHLLQLFQHRAGQAFGQLSPISSIGLTQFTVLDSVGHSRWM